MVEQAARPRRQHPLAIDPIPNAVRTVANLTGMLAVTALADPTAPPPEATLAPASLSEDAPPSVVGGVGVSR